MEQGDFDVTPDLMESPHIRLDIATEFELRKETEHKKWKGEDGLRTGESVELLKIKPIHSRSLFYEDDAHKRFRSIDNLNDDRAKKKSHFENQRLERSEKGRKRIKNECHRLDRTQMEKDTEIKLKERCLSGRREDKKEHRKFKNSVTCDLKRLKYEHKELRSVRMTPLLSTMPQMKEEIKKEQKKQNKMSRDGEMREMFYSKVSRGRKEEGKKCDDDFCIKCNDSAKKDDLFTAGCYRDIFGNVKESPGLKSFRSEKSPKYDLYSFVRSKFDVDDFEEDENQSEAPNNGNSDGKSVSHEERVTLPISGDESIEKIGFPQNHYDNIIKFEDLRTPVLPNEHMLEEPTLPSYYPAVQGCRNVEEFHCLNRINEGTYGVVYRAVDLKLREVVALKRLKMEKEKDGFPITSLREIKLLMKARHPNVVRIKEVVVGSNMDKIYLVMEYVEHDMRSLMESMKEPFTTGEVKTLLIQLLRGIQHLHDNWIIHRDIKTSNLLLSHLGILKIGDFGLAREYGSPLKPYTPIVVTLWYRSPELLLGTKMYSTAVDMWSVGCIFGEFLLRKPLFPGSTQIEQLNCIFKDLGSPNEKIWPGVSDLPGMKKANFSQYQFNQLRRRFGSQISEKGFQLMNSLLTYCPLKRVSADNALLHDYFNETPLPTHPSMFPTWPAKSELCRTKKSPKAPSGGKALPWQHVPL